MKTSRLSLGLVLFVVFLDWVGIGLVYPMFSTMFFHPNSLFVPPDTSPELRGWYLGVLLATMSIAQFLSAPILGTLSDQKGRKPLLMLSLGVATVGYLLSVVAVWQSSIVILIVSRVVVGIAAGNISIVSATIADLSTEETKAQHFGLFSTACGVGFTIGPFLGGKLSELSFTLPFLVAACAVFINLVLIFAFFKETYTARHEVHVRWIDGLYNLKKAFHLKGLRALFIAVIVFSFGWSFFYEFIPVTWISDYGLDVAQIGLLYAYGSGFYALSAAWLIRPIVQRCSHASILFYSLGTLGVLILGLLFHPEAWWTWVYLPCVNFLIALMYPTSTTMVSDWAEPDAQGEVLGIFQSILSVAWAISPLAAGSLLGAHPHMPLLVGGFSMLAASLILGIALRKKIFQKERSR